MIRISTRRLALLSAVLISATIAVAQAPSAPPAQGQQPRGPRPAPTNIKALPKDIGGDDVIKLMRQYTADLGVRCEFCHAQNATTRRTDFPSDANPTKETARYMIAMTADLNDKYLANMPNRMYADPITCGTCHRGARHPSTYVGVPPPPPAPPAPATPPTAMLHFPARPTPLR